MIYRQLTPRYPPEALAFFLPYGQQAGQNWQFFEAELEKALVTQSKRDDATAAAIKLFSLFHQALTA